MDHRNRKTSARGKSQKRKYNDDEAVKPDKIIKQPTSSHNSAESESPMDATESHATLLIKKDKIEILISNVVCMFKLGCTVDLSDVLRRAQNVEKKRGWNFLRLYLRKPKIVATIWGSGSVSAMGTRTEAEAYMGSRRVARLIQKLGYPVRMCRYRVNNITASCLMPWAIELQEFSQNNQPCGQYEPELLNCITYHMPTPKACFFVFPNGSLNITSKNLATVERAVDCFYERAYNSRRERTKAQIEKLLKKRKAACID